MRTPDRSTVMGIVYQGLADWPKNKFEDAAYTQRRFEQMADALINYFALHYMTDGGQRPLPGLPGGDPIA